MSGAIGLLAKRHHGVFDFHLSILKERFGQKSVETRVFVLILQVMAFLNERSSRSHIVTTVSLGESITCNG